MGWEPLCAFLDKDVPKSEYPRINDTKAFQQQQGEKAGMAMRGLFREVAKVVLPVLVVGGAVWWQVGGRSR